MTTPSRMPAVFVGHGSPMNALASNEYTQAWRQLADSMPKPKAILAISAHWFIHGTAVTSNDKLKTIHDFYGFPPELFAIQYPAPGDPGLATRVRDLLSPIAVALDQSWGIDHGTWSVLVHMYPTADIPVLQLSIDGTQRGEFHYQLGQQLSALRNEGVLLIGSGNVVHNLRVMQRDPDAQPYDWALEFNAHVRRCLMDREYESLIHFERGGHAAQMSIPTPEHYLPLLYILGAQRDDDTMSIPCDGIDLASISMMTVKIGGNENG